MGPQFSLKANAENFARNLLSCIKAMTGKDGAITGDYLENRFEFKGCLTSFISFSGTIAGYYLISTKIVDAVASVPRAASSATDDFGSMVSEVLNTAAGQSIAELQEQFAHLTWFPPVVVCGDITFPRFLSASHTLKVEELDMVCSVILNLADLRIARELSKVALQAKTDALTGLLNRAFLLDYIAAMEKTPLLSNFPISFIMIDVDDFKRVNDRFGHHTGDEILVAVGRALTLCSPKGSIAVRYGGDEFMVILPHTAIGEARDIAQDIRVSFGESIGGLLDTQGLPIRTTLSLAVSELGKGDEIEVFLRELDALLYRAKNGGKNMVATQQPT